jgi:hypothetical protein
MRNRIQPTTTPLSVNYGFTILSFPTTHATYVYATTSPNSDSKITPRLTKYTNDLINYITYLQYPPKSLHFTRPSVLDQLRALNGGKEREPETLLLHSFGARAKHFKRLGLMTTFPTVATLPGRCQLKQRSTMPRGHYVLSLSGEHHNKVLTPFTVISK